MERTILKDGGIAITQQVEILGITKSFDSNNTEVKFKLSVETPDRMNDIVLVNGINLENYKNNPVVLFNHSSDIPPIGKGKDLYVDNGVLYGTIQFHEETQLSKELAILTSKGVLSAVSIGFIPLKTMDVPITDELKSQYKFYPHSNIARIYQQSELLEFSLVSIPANQNALVTNSFDLSLLTNVPNEEKNIEVDEITKDEPKIETVQVEIDETVEVEKAGKVISKSNLDKLYAIKQLLTDVIDSASNEDTLEDDKEDEIEEESVTPTIKFDNEYQTELLNKIFKK